MTTKICDRCGEEIPNISPLANACTSKTLYPHVFLMISEMWIQPMVNIDLCHDCAVDLVNFIKQKPKED